MADALRTSVPRLHNMRGEPGPRAPNRPGGNQHEPEHQNHQRQEESVEPHQHGRKGDEASQQECALEVEDHVEQNQSDENRPERDFSIP
jgi:hypothetical protein